MIQDFGKSFYEYNLPWMEYNIGNKRTMEAVKNADIVHICFQLGYISEIKKQFPNKPVIITFGGSDIRGKWKQQSVETHYSKADLVTVKSKDLLIREQGIDPPTDVLYTPIPVDCNFWSRTEPYIPKTALRLQRWHGAQWKNMATDFCKENNLELTQYHRSGPSEIMIEKFHDYLQKFEYYIDIKPAVARILKLQNEIVALSGTALQQLSLGGKVYYWNRIIEKFPEEHNDEIQANKWFKIYQELLN